MGITTGSLRHPNLRARLHGAMIRAAAASRRIRWDRPSIGMVEMTNGVIVYHYRGCWTRRGFAFFDAKMRDITDTVLRALRESEPLPDVDGWRG